jgi:hypothetical protein
VRCRGQRLGSLEPRYLADGRYSQMVHVALTTYQQNCTTVCRDVLHNVLKLDSSSIIPLSLWNEIYLKWSLAALNNKPGNKPPPVQSKHGKDYGRPRYGEMDTFDFAWLLLHQPKGCVTTFGPGANGKIVPLTVIVPAQIATPYPQPSQTVTGTNLAISACTSPVVLGIGTNVDLFTDYSIHMTITVWDQFMTSVGDLYAGAAISETSGGTVYPINQTLTSSSTYTDPFGPGYVSASNVSPSDPRVAAWPSQPLGPFPIATQTPTTPVQVDGFSIGTISTRTWTSTSPNTVTITWPD